MFSFILQQMYVQHLECAVMCLSSLNLTGNLSSLLLLSTRRSEVNVSH